MNKLSYGYYSYKDKVYRVLGIVSMKNPVNRKWEAAVMYDLEDSLIDITFIRLLPEFIDKFEGVPEETYLYEKIQR